MPTMQTRRRFLCYLSMAGAIGLLGAPRVLAADGTLETTTVRIAKDPGICVAPQYIAAELLRAEGFTDVRYWKDRPAPPPRWRKASSISTRTSRQTTSGRSMPARPSRCSPACMSAVSSSSRMKGSARSPT